jgi:hypothetical protein
VSGTPWKRERSEDDPEDEEAPRVRWLKEDERSKPATARDEDANTRRMKLFKEDFFDHGFTTGCSGCKAIIERNPPQSHNESCRKRMDEAIGKSEKGEGRKRRYMEKEEQLIARKLEREEPERLDKEKREREAHVDAEAQVEEAGAQVDERAQKRGNEEIGEPKEKRLKGHTEESRKRKTKEGERPRKKQKDEDDDDGAHELDFLNETSTEPILYNYNPVEWDLMNTETSAPEVIRFDDTTWEPLDSKMVVEGEKEEMSRFKFHGVYSYVKKEIARNDPAGIFIKTK